MDIKSARNNSGGHRARLSRKEDEVGRHQVDPQIDNGGQENGGGHQVRPFKVMPDVKWTRENEERHQVHPGQFPYPGFRGHRFPTKSAYSTHHNLRTAT